MQIRYDRIQRAQALMKQHGMIGIMIMNHDDYQYFFGTVRVQPRAIIPADGPPVLVGFFAEEPELVEAAGQGFVRTFSHVGEQISDVRNTFREIFGRMPPGVDPTSGEKPRIGMQMWFSTPAFLVDLFRRVNPQFELVPSDPVMDELRMVKESDEIETMREAQRIATIGMDRARELIRPGVTGHEIATEVLYTMMKAGAEGTSTPIHVNSGPRSCWIHGKVHDEPIQRGDFVVLDLTPMYRGYCSNLARTFVVGEPEDWQLHLLNAYQEMKERTRQILQPGVTVAELDDLGHKVCEEHGLGEYHIRGIGHSLGLRFEETPATTIIPTHRTVKLRENMTMTIGHTILAIPGRGGARFEDVYRVTPEGGELLTPYPIDWQLPAE